MLVAWDYEESGLLGSAAFVKEYLLPKINQSVYDKPLGSMSIETNLNYNEENDTQTMPPGLNLIAPTVTDELKRNGNRGDFYMIIARKDDADLGRETAKHMKKQSNIFIIFLLSIRYMIPMMFTFHEGGMYLGSSSCFSSYLYSTNFVVKWSVVKFWNLNF